MKNTSIASLLIQPTEEDCYYEGGMPRNPNSARHRRGQKSKKVVVEEGDGGTGMNLIPTEMLELNIAEADKIRTILVFCVFLHVLFVAFDFLIYNSMFMVVSEVLFCYIAFYCYMTLDTMPLYVYLVLLTVSPFFMLWNISRMLGLWAFILYPLQTACYAYMAFLMFQRISAFRVARREYEFKQKNLSEKQKSKKERIVES